MTFKKGESGNPRGVSSELHTIAKQINTKCAQIALAGVTLLESIIMNEEEHPRLRLDALKIAMERGCGKPFQSILLENLEDLKPSEMTTEQLHAFILTHLKAPKKGAEKSLN